MPSLLTSATATTPLLLPALGFDLNVKLLSPLPNRTVMMFSPVDGEPFDTWILSPNRPSHSLSASAIPHQIEDAIFDHCGLRELEFGWQHRIRSLLSCFKRMEIVLPCNR